MRRGTHHSDAAKRRMSQSAKRRERERRAREARLIELLARYEQKAAER
jgi:hypothetical protein